ncbi:amidase [Streptomyces sp. AC536]|uniref:amidase n=1 Tax=Streptomyces buecherae TaxID=2763006 RepID=UPI00164E1A6B|nr:amidase [Streptomyces buecherae]MBC3983396.1 amidase [Streptomyces buecherae]QNJ43520.1 amidase [Streptomyces buecherae]
MRPFELTLTEASAALRRRELSAAELTRSVLERIEAVDARVGAYVTVTDEAARAAAERADAERAAGRDRGPLHGVPGGLKDLIDVAGLPTTASSQARSGHVAHSDSAVAARLREAGAVLVGKTHTHEFAYGLTTPQSRNAVDQDRVAGGSSGGSAVAVAAGAATFALGTDTGGSIRVPAALNGLVGLKPTYGLLPRSGVTSLSWSLDHVGPITRTVRDAALLFAALAGPDAGDPASLSAGSAGDVLRGADEDGLRGLRVGVPSTYYFERVDPEVEAAVRAAIARLGDLGAELVEVTTPMDRYIHAIHWGLMVPEATAYHEQTLRSTPQSYGPDVRVLLEAGELVSAGDYLRAQRARTLLRRAWAEVYEQVDVVAAPTVPMTAVPVDQHTVHWPDGTVESVSDAYVRLSAPANITGMPSLTLPVGRDAAGLPIGMQLMAAPLADATVLRAGRAYEAAHGVRATPGALVS